MNNLIKQVIDLKNSSVGKVVEQRLVEFDSFKKRSSEDWFCELCFCLLTANSKASTAIKIYDELGFKGFSEYSLEDVTAVIRKYNHRFHNNKAKYIVQAREFLDLKWIIQGVAHEEGSSGAREWLVENVKGIGYKEASHFLRNVGFKDVAILDRHILNLMVENNLLKQKPKSLSKKNYLELEQNFKKVANKAKMSVAELDLYMWCLKVGDVLR
ncbi:MAG: N-glycosylase/DNA lyase [Nanoarchaeota archaeon]|nr:N-glycosylase/DNA lyase [Nanoarchaeota archaeon]MBU1269876.1 N-glycosylase/DNA lyase [Nanoarchaeota archaeon]MBU1604272.1 N-glycosylase/DNA lyase [Nanoarchaeota archaeon]MBU2443676.1 N-glycosylase/DNA lyase [Nanoarchaeota archaeon]